ncbi:MAG TPA: patatin-like phospholipase family protein [Steroidobacteraceae bacterium]|nr:patatin-like phospholipase family protein [Steroidobacteraceae bacterium]
MNRAERVVWIRIGAVRALLAALAWLTLASVPARASDSGPSSSATGAKRLRIGLVLSGGGARGAAHIGVLKTLAQMHIPIDAIAGTSMGAVVGGLYASGLSPSQIESVMNSVNWGQAFNELPPRRELSFRRKEEDRSFLFKLPLGIRGGKLRLPSGLIEAETLTRMLRRLTLPVAGIKDFDDLPTPFRAVATDLSSGEPVVMRAGDLTTAMRASLSAPGVFSPVEREGRLLVDGGIAENLPIDVAREMHVDVLIVVDVGLPLSPRAQLVGPAAISNQMLSILIRRESQRQLATLTPRDIVVTPALGDASSFDFSIVKRAITIGEQAARDVAPRLRGLAVSPEVYAAYLAERRADHEQLPMIQFVHVTPDSQRYAPALHAIFDDLIGKRLDPGQVDSRVTDMYGRGDLSILDYRVVNENGQSGLDLGAQRNSYGPDYLRLGLSLQDDFHGNAFYNASALLVMSELTSTGAEWVWNLQEGISPHIYSEFFLPLSNYWTYFLMPNFQWSATNVPLDDSTQQQLADFRLRNFDYGLDFGRQLGNWGEARIGVLHDEGTSYVRVGDPDLPSTHFRDYGFFVRFSYDQVDDVDFPHNGQLATVQWTSENSWVAQEAQAGMQRPLNQVTLNWLGAQSFGRETVLLWTTAGTTFSQTEPYDLHTQFLLGGLFNLSGLPVESLAGSDFGIARFLFYHRIGSGGEGILNFPAYIGFSLEAGNAWPDRESVEFSSLRKDGSVFVGFDTPVGPLYLATGFDQSGAETFYLFLGRMF